MTDTRPTNRPDRAGYGAALIVFAVFLMALQDAIIKFASSDLSLWQIYVLRSAIAVPVLLAATSRNGDGAAALRGAFGRWAMLRAALLTGMYVSLYAALPLLPLATLAAGFYTGPLFIALLSGLATGETVGRRGWLAVAAGFGGVLLILQPGGSGFSPAVLLPLLSGFFYAVAAVLTRAKCHAERAMTLAISLNVVLFVAGGIASFLLLLPVFDDTSLSPFLLGDWTPLDAGDGILVVILALLIVGIGIALAAAYQTARSVVVATFDYSYLVFSAMFGFVFFGEHPGMQTVAGMIVIAGAGLVAVRSRRSRG